MSRLLMVCVLACLFAVSLAYPQSEVTGPTLYTGTTHQDTVYPRFLVPMFFSDFGGEVRRDTFGVHPFASYCIDGTIDNSLDERELPPKPPAGAPDYRFTDHRFPGCLGTGLRLNVQEDSKRDTFKLEMQSGGGGYPLTIQWPTGLNAGFTSLELRDPFGGFFVNINMLTDTAVVISNAALTSLLIYADPIPVVWSNTIYATAGSGGSINPGGVVGVSFGSTRTFTMIPDAGYMVDSVIVDGVGGGSAPSYTFTNITADHTIHVTFRPDPGWSQGYIVPITARDVNLISRVDTFGVYPGATYCIDDSLGAGLWEKELPPKPPVGVFDFRFVEHQSGRSCLGVGVRLHLQEIGKLDTFKVDFQPTDGLYPMTFTWPMGLNSHWTMLVIQDVFGGVLHNVDMLTEPNLVVTNPAITTLQIIGLRPASLTRFNITASAGTGGNINPSGIVSVDSGGTQAYTITPNVGYLIDSVVVDGVNVGAVSGYTFTNVSAHHSIRADFRPSGYLITASAGPNGTITPSGSVAVAPGATQSFTITPAGGYQVAGVLVDGSPVGPVTNYAFNFVSANHTIHATFQPGSVTPSGFIVPISAGDAGAGSRIDTFGVHPNATYCIDGDVAPGLVESELPPTPPVGAFDFRFIDHRSGPGACLGVGIRLHLQEMGKVDTFRVKYQPGGAGFPITIAWPAGLDSNWSSLVIQDLFGGFLVNVNMLDTTVLVVTNSSITSLQIIGTPRSPSVGQYSINASAGANGSITPNGLVSVDSGGSQAFNIVPGGGYAIDSVMVDGVRTDSLYGYTFTNVRANHTIHADFRIDTGGTGLFRTFTPGDLGRRKAVSRRPLFYEFTIPFVNNSGQPADGLYVKFTGPASGIVQITEHDPLDDATTSNWKEWEISGGTVAPGATVLVKGTSTRYQAKILRWRWKHSSFDGENHPRFIPTGQVAHYPMPNSANVRDEMFDGGFGGGGLTVGRPRTDSSRQYGWVQLTNGNQLRRSLLLNRRIHQAIARCFDFTGRRQSLTPQFHDNALFANQAALKFNIQASAVGMTPVGLGELIFEDTVANPLNGLTIQEIASRVDSLLTGFYVGTIHVCEGYSLFDQVNRSVERINAAFAGVIDTVSSAGGLVLRGVRDVQDVPFLRKLPGATPIASGWNPSSADNPIPSAYGLYQNYPNPFNPTTTIRFDLPWEAKVTLTVHNLLGQEIARLLDNEVFFEGGQEEEFDAGAIGSGIYYYRISAAPTEAEDGALHAPFTAVRKMVLVR